MAQLKSTENSVKFRHVVFEICERTYRCAERQAERQTYIHTDNHNTSHPYRVTV